MSQFLVGTEDPQSADVKALPAQHLAFRQRTQSSQECEPFGDNWITPQQCLHDSRTEIAPLLPGQQGPGPVDILPRPCFSSGSSYWQGWP